MKSLTAIASMLALVCILAFAQPPGQPADIQAAQSTVNALNNDINAGNKIVSSLQAAVDTGINDPAEKAALLKAIAAHKADLQTKNAALATNNNKVRDWQQKQPVNPVTGSRRAWATAPVIGIGTFQHIKGDGTSESVNKVPIYKATYGTQMPPVTSTSSYIIVAADNSTADAHLALNKPIDGTVTVNAAIPVK